ncbi:MULTISPECIES: hypothetical protein [unclassified Microcoleus]|uniref:hypothetical protein n=1 Tax=unclassified Microcoleus TaxID=2642155 RepID=UPI002FD5A380
MLNLDPLGPAPNWVGFLLAIRDRLPLAIRDRKYAARSNLGLTFIQPVFTENKQQPNQASRKKPGFSSSK